MKGLGKFPPDYFLKYKEKPVKLKPYTKKQGYVADLYLKKVKSLLDAFNLKVSVRGSTAFKILGKGDIEVGVYPKEVDWKNVLIVLENKFGKPENVESDYARFNDVYNKYEVEIIVLKRREAVIDQKLHDYLLRHKELLTEYTKIKKKYAYSKREYQIQKNDFLSRVIKEIPE